MEFIDQNTIKLDKVENELDRFVLDFLKILEKHTKYVIVSGYVAILFGRNRNSEDVDVFVEGFSDFKQFMEECKMNGFWVLNEDDPAEVYSMLKDNLAIRIARKGSFEPNFEIKFAKTDLDRYSLENRIKVILNSSPIYISSLELNIAYKLFLASDKDIEDARFLFRMFKDRVDLNKLMQFVLRLNVQGAFNKYLV